METFNITSGLVNLSDPCYPVGTFCGLYNIPAKNGMWNVSVEEQDNRVKGWQALHSDFTDLDINYSKNYFGVDSGQLGIFDSSIYDGEENPNFDGWSNEFYQECCNTTLGPKNPVTNSYDSGQMYGTVFDAGFVSNTGYGDGCYNGLLMYNSNKVLIGFKIQFIEDVDEDEDDE